MKKAAEPQVRVHIWLFERDVERLRYHYGDNIGISKAARMMVRKMLDRLDSKIEATERPVKVDEDEPVETSDA